MYMFRSSGGGVSAGGEEWNRDLLRQESDIFGKRLLVNVHCFSFPSAKIQQEKAEKKSFRIAVAKPSH